MQEIVISTQQKNQTILPLPRTLIPNDIYTVLVIPGNAAGNSTLNSGSIIFCEFKIIIYWLTVKCVNSSVFPQQRLTHKQLTS